jgi:hypothetical protein
MKTNYHIEITRFAFENQFSERALNTIIDANIKQDRIFYQIGHDHIHFDGSAFECGFQYIAEQEGLLFQHLQTKNNTPAWEALGRITHSWQDFFSHSNYVQLWAEIHQNQSAEEIKIDDLEILNHPGLASGKSYVHIELLIMLPGLKALIKPLIPRDSHAYMNLDSPSSGHFFNYAYWAALKATRAACERIFQQINQIDNSGKMIRQFKDKKSGK